MRVRGCDEGKTVSCEVGRRLWGCYAVADSGNDGENKEIKVKIGDNGGN